MKIQGRCRNCGRGFPIDEVLTAPETAGMCPFCGMALDREYHALLVEALGAVQSIGRQMVNVLERAKAVGENLEIDPESVLAPIRAALVAREESSARRRETATAARAEGSPVA